MTVQSVLPSGPISDGAASVRRQTLTPRVLLVDDDDEMRGLLERVLRLRGVDAVSVADPQDVLTRLEAEEFDAVVTDIRMPSMDGFELLARVKSAHPHVGVVLVTAYGDLGAAVEAMRLGASDFITKPVEVEALQRAIKSASQRGREEIRRLGVQSIDRALDGLVGSSPALQDVIRKLRRIAGSDCTVLITGESGTGKEMIARTLHEHGPRRERPFIPINCAAVPADLLESEFFGHRRGAFTGAAQAHDGLFVAANGGTIFFDEIAAMPIELQAKLLRALQERTVRAVGSRNELPFDVRVIAAANEDLDEAVEKRAFRRDLLFRLDVMRIDLPPLRERGNDALELAQFFLTKYAPKLGKQLLGFDAEASERMLAYNWPGNVRELENCVHAAVALAQGPWIMADDLPPKVRRVRRSAPPSHDSTPALPLLEEVERQHIERVLRAVRGNKAAAARVLGINRVTLYRKLAHSNHRQE